jgi:hypothetical protein
MDSGAPAPTVTLQEPSPRGEVTTLRRDQAVVSINGELSLPATTLSAGESGDPRHADAVTAKHYARGIQGTDGSAA